MKVYEPGPDEPDTDDERELLIFENSPAGEVLGAVYAAIENGNIEALARLVLAAPELLDALENALEAMVQADCASLTVVPRLRALLKRVKGTA